jgi:hypothetical protein
MQFRDERGEPPAALAHFQLQHSASVLSAHLMKAHTSEGDLKGDLRTTVLSSRLLTSNGAAPSISMECESIGHPTPAMHLSSSKDDAGRLAECRLRKLNRAGGATLLRALADPVHFVIGARRAMCETMHKCGADRVNEPRGIARDCRHAEAQRVEAPRAPPRRSRRTDRKAASAGRRRDSKRRANSDESRENEKSLRKEAPDRPEISAAL